jgi:hypothetical protein
VVTPDKVLGSGQSGISESKKSERGSSNKRSFLKIKATSILKFSAIILLDSHKSTISIQNFGANQIEQAMSTYDELEKKFFNDLGINVVLVNAGDIKKLEAKRFRMNP